jgi:hypothetical protein
MGHISPRKIRLLAKQGILPKRLLNCRIPICTSCLFGKATRRPWRSKVPGNPQGAAKTLTRPGECVSVDQMESPTPGLVAQMRGKPTKARYKVATVFIDHVSRLSYVHLQKTTSADETVEAKQAFERFASANGVKVLHYHADNGIFADNQFKAHVTSQGQTLTFCGVNAHFQNGLAERRIRELTDHARTMLIHAQKRWPSAITAALWPYALRQANELLNGTPNIQIQEKVPIAVFAKTDVAPNPKHWFSFGCPVYVLDNDLQAGKKIAKWSDRARIGVYLGQSPQHARTVSLVLSLQTGLVSPQFHVRMDSSFETLRTLYQDKPPLSLWQSKCHFIQGEAESGNRMPPTIAPLPLRAGPMGILPEQGQEGGVQGSDPQGAQPQAAEEEAEVAPPEGAILPVAEVPDDLGDPAPANEAPAAEPQGKQVPQGPTLRRSQRTRRPVQRLIAESATHVAYEVLAVPTEDSPDEESPLLAYAASADPDTMYLHEALKQPDRKQFLEAMVKEVEAQTANGNWKIVRKDEVPEDAAILPAVWAMKRKRKIATREVYKWKARLNIDGSKQVKGLNYWETYAPVASWPTIRLILIMSIVSGWYTKQIDYVLAYTQAEAETDNLYMKIPKGFEINDGNSDEYVLKIQKNIYGQKQAGRVWNKHLVSRLQAVGFKQSMIDECVFYRGRSIYVLYTDDSILAGPDEAELDEIVEAIKSAGLDLTVEGDISDFLGVNIKKDSDGNVHLTQPHLIEQVLKVMRLDKSNVAVKQTPAASSKLLRRHLESQAFDGHYDYRSIVGKINYLEKSTRPDISCAIHQCARFGADPRQEHGKALSWLGRYLAGNKDKGLVFKPDPEQEFDCYVDADFSGNWNSEEASDDPDTARSRTGYIITYANCPIIWASKLQTSIALSTTEAEYIALSTALREVIPLMELIEEMKAQGFGFKTSKPTVHCKVFEDNSGAIEIATVHKFRPRTKHINTQYHHFRSYVIQGRIIIKAISTEEQRADMLTKPLPVNLMVKFRKAVMGW